jgi:hypothetical protein
MLLTACRCVIFLMFPHVHRCSASHVLLGRSCSLVLSAMFCEVIRDVISKTKSKLIFKTKFKLICDLIFASNFNSLHHFLF